MGIGCIPVKIFNRRVVMKMSSKFSKYFMGHIVFGSLTGIL